MARRDALHQLIDLLAEADIGTAERFLTLLSQEPIGPAFAESIRRGLAQADAGQTVVCRDYADMVEKLLAQD